MATTVTPDQLARWRLILGKDSQESFDKMGAGGCALSPQQLEMDEALEAIYSSQADEEISRALARCRRSEAKPVGFGFERPRAFSLCRDADRSGSAG